MKRSPVKQAHSILHKLQNHEIFLPLMDDWLFRPLLHIKKVDDSNLQSLASSIFKYLDTEFQHDPILCEQTTRLSKETVVVLITHLITDQGLSFNKDSLLSMFNFLQH